MCWTIIQFWCLVGFFFSFGMKKKCWRKNFYFHSIWHGLLTHLLHWEKKTNKREQKILIQFDNSDIGKKTIFYVSNEKEIKTNFHHHHHCTDVIYRSIFSLSPFFTFSFYSFFYSFYLGKRKKNLNAWIQISNTRIFRLFLFNVFFSIHIWCVIMRIVWVKWM